MSSRDLLHAQQYAMIDDYLIDCLLSDEHEYEAEVTEYPVESGATITDNIRPKPLTITMECLISNTPIGPLATIRDPLSNVAGTFQLPSYHTGQDPNARETAQPPVSDAYNRMLEIRDKREPVTIRTSLGTFSNMAMKSLSIPRASGRGDDLQFTASFQQIKIVRRKRSVVVQTHRGNCTAVQGKKVSYLWRQATPPGSPWYAGAYNSEGRQILRSSNNGGAPVRGADPAVWVLYDSSKPISQQYEYLHKVSQKGRLAAFGVSAASDLSATLTSREVVAFHFDMARDRKERNAEAGREVTVSEYDRLRAANKLKKVDDMSNGQTSGITRGPATGTKPPTVSLGKPTRVR